MTFTRHCPSADETATAGAEFATLLRAGDVVLLSGRLGAGKTVWVQGLARALGVRDRVTSPTFTVVREHAATNEQGIATLWHADVYRVESVDEIIDLALGELVEEHGVAVVEWGEFAETVFGPEVFRLHFAVNDDDSRTLTVSGALAERRAAAVTEWAS